MSRHKVMVTVLALLGTGFAIGFYLWISGRYDFANEAILWLLLLVPLLGLYDILSTDRRNPKVQLSAFSQLNTSILSSLVVYIPALLRYASLTLLIVALARPQSQLSWQDVSTEGIDIVITMDLSASMLAKDFEPNRLESAKEVAIEFIKQRRNDRIGLVVYEGESFTQCPLTTDHAVLTSLFKDVRSGMVQGGTAIGMGLATSVNRLRESEAKSKVVILLTDGDNNQGSIAPLTAAEIAKSYGVRVYTIGVGSLGKALSPVGLYADGRYKYEYVDVKINEESLREIAAMTGGKYFRATNGQALAEIYSEIDRLEKTKINVTEHSRHAEEFYIFALIGSALLLGEYLFRTLYLQTLP